MTVIVFIPPCFLPVIYKWNSHTASVLPAGGSSSLLFFLHPYMDCANKVTYIIPGFCPLHSYCHFRQHPDHTMHINHHKSTFRYYFLQWSLVTLVSKRICSLHWGVSIQKIPPMTSYTGSACKGQGRVEEQSILTCKACVVGPYSINETRNLLPQNTCWRKTVWVTSTREKTFPWVLKASLKFEGEPARQKFI